MAGAVKAEDSKGKRLDEKRESPAELHYKFQPLKSQQVIIVENFNPGAITKVEIGREGKGARKEIYTAVAKVIIEKYRVLNLTFPLTEYEVTDVWINVDFKKIPAVVDALPAIAGMHFFGIVQAIEAARTNEWVDFYKELLGFTVLPQGQYFGVLPKGTLLESPCHKFYLQLVEPPEQAAVLAWQEKLTRVGFGAPDITVLVAQLSARGVNFVESNSVHTSDKGAVTYLGGTSFEFVKSHLGAGK